MGIHSLASQLVFVIFVYGWELANLPYRLNSFIDFIYWHWFAIKWPFLFFDACSDIFFQAQEKLGPVDMLVNCAGMSLSGKFEDLEVSTFEVSKTCFFLHWGSHTLKRRTSSWVKALGWNGWNAFSCNRTRDWRKAGQVFSLSDHPALVILTSFWTLVSSAVKWEWNLYSHTAYCVDSPRSYHQESFVVWDMLDFLVIISVFNNENPPKLKSRL